MADFLDEKRKEITSRLTELQPVVAEFRRLEAAVSALAGVGGASTGGPSTQKRPGRPPGSRSKAAAKVPVKSAAKVGRPAKRRAGRRKGSGTRAAEALAAVKEQPGITIKELAAKMGIAQNYLYRVMPGLEKEKKVKKQGGGWHPTGR
jgi:hypothetical protein